jgi:hypothetical protein
MNIAEILVTTKVEILVITIAGILVMKIAEFQLSS